VSCAMAQSGLADANTSARIDDTPTDFFNMMVVRLATASGVVRGFVDQRLNVAAGIRQQMEKDVERAGNLRLLEPHFMVISQAMGVPRSKGAEASAYLSAFVEEMKSFGFVARSLERHHIVGASVGTSDG